jgi:uncharacterized protein YifE (UPF0438 family)
MAGMKADSKIDYIPLDKCKDGFIYILWARKAALGVFCKDKKSFKLSMFRSRNFLFEEEHWDTGYGTAKPLEEVECAPVFGTSDEMLSYLKQHPVLSRAEKMCEKTWKKHIRLQRTSK